MFNNKAEIYEKEKLIESLSNKIVDSEEELLDTTKKVESLEVVLVKQLKSESIFKNVNIWFIELLMTIQIIVGRKRYIEVLQWSGHTKCGSKRTN